jgi:ABC-type sugar transport system permease subunit
VAVAPPASVQLFAGRGDSLAESPLRGREQGRIARQERRWGLGFVSPWMVGLTLFFALPIVASLVISFTSYELVDQDGASTKFVGIDNWRRLFSDPEVRTGVWVTVRFAVVFVPLVVVVPLALAYLLTLKSLRFRGFFRAMFYLPTMVPFIATVIVWRFYLNSKSGWFAKVFDTVGITTPDFVNDKRYVMAALWMIGLWGIGNAMIINIAALQGVPKDLYEAATLEGAGRWRLFRDVTLPMISPIVFYNLVLTLVGLGHYFVVPFALSEGTGDPEGATKFYSMYFYRQTFTFFQAGYGSALAWMMFIVVFALTGLLFWSSKWWVHYEFEER